MNINKRSLFCLLMLLVLPAISWGSDGMMLDALPGNGNENIDSEAQQYDGKKFRGVQVVDENYLLVHFKDGDVIFKDDGQGDCAYQSCTKPGDNTVVLYGEPLNTDATASTSNWHISSADDDAYGQTGLKPLASYRKSKLNGMAQLDWWGSDFAYEHTMEHWIYLLLPSSLVPGKTYTLHIAPGTNTDIDHATFTYDIYNSRSEAVHVNLSGYHPNSAVQAADLYIWMGDGGARDYSSFEGNRVYLYNVETQEAQEVGQVSFWRRSAGEMRGYNFTQSNVWNVDFTGDYTPGVYRLAVEGVGASQNFVIGEDAVFEPFRVSTLGYFYMRIGQDNLDMVPVPRRPLWIPGQDPQDCKVVVTDMHPYHADWQGGGDRWDSPSFFSNYVKSGAPENPDAKGGHSDALDWDRQLSHVSNIYDMLLPYILTRGNGAIGSDDLGIAESDNGIPDIIDEARYEVDFWLSLRFEGGYSHGLTNPDYNSHILYQAGNTAIAAWANAVNAAMLAEAYRIAGATDLMSQYLEAAEEAWNYASGLSDQMLDNELNLGMRSLLGRDLRMTAAAWLYNLTGETIYEDVIDEESIISSGTSEFLYENRNQLYAMAAYLQTEQDVHYAALQSNMRAAVIHQAKQKEARFSDSRPSRRATDNKTGYFHTVQFVHRTILAHAVATSDIDRALFERALVLEADWGLGRNPANVIQMTTATTKLELKRSIECAYTSGWNDGTPGVHPGHTPYMNIDDLDSSTVAGRPSWMTEKCYPGNVYTWPKAELYFNTRYVWAHSEFTPRETMRGKMALYGYLLGMTRYQTGSLQVTISPQEAIDAGALWRRVGTSAWYNSGETETGIPMGSYEVEFNDISGWGKPANQDVTIDADQTTDVSATYEPGEGHLVTPDLWIRAVINTVEKGPINAFWQKGGEDTTSRGDTVIWGHFYANPTDVTWGSENNPDLFVKIWFDVSGRIDVNYFHVSVPDIEVYSDYPYDGTADEHGTTTMSRRYIRHYYQGGQSYSDENFEDGNPPPGYSPAGNPSGYSTINDLRIGSIINTVEKGPIDSLWRSGGQDTTARGDQVVWGYFYASPSDVTWGSQNNPDLFVKIWFDVSGRVDVNFFHVSVPDIEVYSDLANDSIYNQKGTTIMDNRYIRHEYWR